MPILNQTVTYNGSYLPTNSTGGMAYSWLLYLSDGTTLAVQNTHYVLVNSSLLTNSSIQVQWLITGNFKVNLQITQIACNRIVLSPVFNVEVTGSNVVPTGCVSYTYTGGASGGTISYTFCDGISVETVAVAPGETASLCCLDNPVPTTTGTVTYTLNGVCNAPSSGKDAIFSYWLQDSNDFHNCDVDSYLYPNCNPNNYNPALRSNGAEGRMKSYIRRDRMKPPFYASFHSVRTIQDNAGNSGSTDYNVRFDQQAFDRTMAFVYESGAKAIELYFYDNDSDVGEHITYNQNTTSPFALAVQYCYALGALGYNAVTSMDRIISHMSQSRYYKVGNRPVITIDAPEGEKFHVDRYIEQSGATWVVDANEPGGGYWLQNSGYSGQIVFAPTSGFVRASGNTPNRRFTEYIMQQYAALNSGVSPYLVIEGTFFYHDGSGGFGHDAVSAYAIVPTTFNSDHSYQSMADYNMLQLNASTQTIIPTMMVGFENIRVTGQLPNYVDSGTPSEIITHYNQIKAFAALHPDSPFIKWYSIGESGEAGKGNLLVRLNSDGSYDKEYINAAKTAITI